MSAPAAADRAAALSEAETRELLRRAQSGDFNAKEQLAAANTRLVRSIARRFAISGRDPEDLFQVGCIGLLKAIAKFDFSYEVCFSTYAVPLIMGEIRRFLRDDSPLTISRSLKERALLLERKRRELRAAWGAEPELWQLAEACQISEEQALAALEAMRPPLSISEARYRGQDNGTDISDLLPDERASFDRQLADSLTLRAYIDQLPPRLAAVIRGRYFEDRTQSDLAADLGVSQVQVSRLEKQALNRIRAEILANEA